MKLKDKIELIKKYNISAKELEEVQKQVEPYEKFLEDNRKTIEDVKMWEQKFEEKILDHVYKYDNFKIYFYPQYSDMCMNYQFLLILV